MDATNQRFTFSELLQRLEDLGVAMRTYADSLLDARNGEVKAAAPTSEQLVKADD